MKLSVILIISYEKPQTAREALESVLASRTGFPFEVIVVDNAASEAEAKLGPFQGRVQVIRNGENLGFGRANNRGAAAAQGEYLLFLNSDTKVDPDALARLAAFADEHPQTGAVGPLVLDADGGFQLSYGRPLSLFSEFWQKTVAASRARRLDPRDLKTREVGWVSGCCLLTRREYFPGGRVFDEEIFLYFEDSELCLRLRKTGKRVYFFPGARIVHFGGASVRSVPVSTAVEYRRSQLHVYRKHLPGWQLRILKVLLFLKFRWRLLVTRNEGKRAAAMNILRLLRKEQRSIVP